MVTSATWFSRDVTHAFVFDAYGGQRLSSYQALYAVYEAYYDNSVWSDADVSAALTVGMSDLTEGFQVRGIWSLVKPIVDTYRDYTLQGMMGLEGEAGIDTWIAPGGNQRIIKPMLDVFGWSSLQTEQRKISSRAAKYGTCLLVVVDEFNDERPEWSRVRIEVRHPGELVRWRFDRFGNLTHALLETVETEVVDERGTERRYTRGTYYTADSYVTYRDGQEFAYDDNPTVGGRAVSRWPNPHGFVPIRVVRHEENEGDLGNNAWYSIIPALNELNLRASQIGGNIGQHFSPAYFASGMQAPRNTDGSIASVARDGILYGPAGSTLTPLVATLQYDGAYTHINAILRHIVDIQPELLLSELARKAGDISGVAVQKMMTALIKRLEAAQVNYDTELVKALQMALSMGRNVAGTGFNLWQARYGADIGDFHATTQVDGFDATIHRPEVLPLSRLEELELAAAERAAERPTAAPVATPTPGQAAPGAFSDDHQVIQQPSASAAD